MEAYPHFYLRVGPCGSGSTRFIRDLATKCDMTLFTKHSRTPIKMFHRQPTKFEDTVGRFEGKKMVAFDDTPVKNMCSCRTFKHLDRYLLTCNSLKGINTWVFSVNDKGTKSSGELDAEDILVHVFGKEGLEGRLTIMYNKITEIHHMLPDGNVRILACGGKKLEDTIVLSYAECIERVVSGHSACKRCVVVEFVV